MGERKEDMKTNDLKKGARVVLRNGWEAEMADNRKGWSRYAKVYGEFTEVGSIYTHNIVEYKGEDGKWHDDIEYTKDQLKMISAGVY